MGARADLQQTTTPRHECNLIRRAYTSAEANDDLVTTINCATQETRPKSLQIRNINREEGSKHVIVGTQQSSRTSKSKPQFKKTENFIFPLI
jgi:hypothetical protein